MTTVTHAVMFTLDLFEREILPDLALELAEKFHLDPAVLHASLEEKWLDFRESRERLLAQANRPNDIGPTRGTA